MFAGYAELITCEVDNRMERAIFLSRNLCKYKSKKIDG